jgi:hypothetical protein
MLYMFQAVPPPIIRSSNLYIQHRVFVKTIIATCHDGLTKYPMLYIQFWAPDDRRRNRLKHAEHFTEINKLCNVASCWLYFKKNCIISTTTESPNLNLEMRSACSDILVDKPDIRLLLKAENSASWFVSFTSDKNVCCNKMTYRHVSTLDSVASWDKVLLLGTSYSATGTVTEASAKAHIWCRVDTPYANYGRP